jgi:hypothetical protein
MVDSLAPGETLADVLGARARSTSSQRLLLDAVGGLAIGTLAIWSKPPGWALIVAAAACLACYGCWAVAERQLGPGPGASSITASHAWKALWYASACLGLLAFVLLLVVFLGGALGQWIS